MYCPRCGEANVNSDKFCSHCGQDLATYGRLWAGASAPMQSLGAPQAPPESPAPPPQPGLAAPAGETPSTPSYLGWAVTLLVCCWPAWPAGVAAVVYASRTESRLAAGDAIAAWESSRKAKTWCWITFGAGVVLWVVSLSLIVLLSR